MDRLASLKGFTPHTPPYRLQQSLQRPLTVSALITQAVLLTALMAQPAAAASLPSPKTVKAQFRSSETLVLSREGEVLQRVRTDANVRRGQWMALQDVSPALRLALLLSEDQRFYAHSGVDWRAVSAAAWGNLWHQKTRGASTITMQLAGLLDDDWRAAQGGRTWTQKLGQAVAAQQLERSWRKDEILEAYLNLLPFRGELVGIDALSRSLFGKAPHGLDDTEAAIAAALVRGPNASTATVAQRACGVLQAMQSPDADCQTLQWRTEQALRARLWPASEGLAPHWARRVLAQHPPGEPPAATVRTTVRADVQQLALDSLQRQLRELQGRNVEDGAVLVLDNASGEVLAWVGSSGSLSQAAEVDAVVALRQPGSTLKPFLYAQALQEKRLTAASLIEDSSAHIATASGLYIPQNYDRRFRGWVSARVALAASLNVPAVRVLVMVSPDAFFEQLQQLGLPLRESAGFYGYSLALGSAEVPLLHLTNAYRALANQGRWSPVAGAQWSSRTTPPPAQQQVLAPQAAFIVGHMLADAQARSSTFGLDSVLSTRFWSAVKTGTSKDMRDNWAVGWSQRYTVGVWVGNASGNAMHGVSGSSGAAPVWADVMAGLHAQQPSLPPQPPANLVQQQVRFAADDAVPATEPTRQEWFVAGTEQTVFAMHKEAATAISASISDKKPSEIASNKAQAAIKNNAIPAQMRISQPVSGTLLALDPDIPPAHQRVQLQARAAGTESERRDLPQSLRWVLVTLQPQGLTERREIGQGPQVGWLPLPGKHRLELRSASNQLLDSVSLEVRGAGMASPRAPTNRR